MRDAERITFRSRKPRKKPPNTTPIANDTETQKRKKRQTKDRVLSLLGAHQISTVRTQAAVRNPSDMLEAIPDTDDNPERLNPVGKSSPTLLYTAPGLVYSEGTWKSDVRVRTRYMRDDGVGGKGI